MAGRSRYSDTLANAQAVATNTQAVTGVVKIYDGLQPADANTAVTTQNVLATLALGSPAFTVALNVLTAAAIAAVTIAASGVANWFRVFKADGTTVLFDGNVGNQTVTLSGAVAGSATSISVSALAQPLYAGQTLQFTDAVSGVLKPIQVSTNAAAGATSVACSAAAQAIATASVSGQNLTMNNPNLQSGATVSITAMTVTLSESGT